MNDGYEDWERLTHEDIVAERSADAVWSEVEPALVTLEAAGLLPDNDWREAKG